MTKHDFQVGQWLLYVPEAGKPYECRVDRVGTKWLTITGYKNPRADIETLTAEGGKGQYYLGWQEYVDEVFGWRSIETAPTVPEDAACGAHGPYILLSNDRGVWVGSHCPRFVSGYRPENPWSSMMLNHRHMERYASSVPTHWMPLPPPPQGEK